jgi:hypothetical protein
MHEANAYKRIAAVCYCSAAAYIGSAAKYMDLAAGLAAPNMDIAATS